MEKVLRFAVGAFALLFFGMGVGWLLAPSFLGSQLGMTLLQGAGLSTQIGDLASFFLTLGSCILLGLATRNSTWFYPAMMLLGLAAIGRILAWLFHGAALAWDMIFVEVLVVSLLYILSRKQRNEESP